MTPHNAGVMAHNSLRIALLTSSLLGPSAWGSMPHELSRLGWDSVVAAHVGPAPSTADEVVTAFFSALPSSDEWILVPHSNAGLLTAAVARQRRVRAVVYVDARLPRSGRQRMSTDESLRFYESRADSDGILPPWCDWWDQDIRHLFPDDGSRRQCESEMRRLPLDYFRSDVDGTGWDDLPSAYLAFGDVYAAERERASHAGFPTATIDAAEHLHQLISPEDVARRIDQLVQAALRR
jgi:pimeloyl-ACP methyl ester carboxylesterase